jgi:hypothetical protein
MWEIINVKKISVGNPEWKDNLGDLGVDYLEEKGCQGVE